MVSFILLTVVNVFDFIYFSTLLFLIQQTGSRRKIPLVVGGHVTGMQSQAGVDFCVCITRLVWRVRKSIDIRTRKITELDQEV